MPSGTHPGGVYALRVQEKADISVPSNQFLHRPERAWGDSITPVTPLAEVRPVEEELHFPPSLVAAHHPGAFPALLFARAHMRSGRDAKLDTTHKPIR